METDVTEEPKAIKVGRWTGFMLLPHLAMLLNWFLFLNAAQAAAATYGMMMFCYGAYSVASETYPGLFSRGGAWWAVKFVFAFVTIPCIGARKVADLTD